MRLHRVGVNWNPQANCSVRLSDLPPCALRVNVIRGLPVPISEMVSAGHTILLQVGTEALRRYIDPRTDWQSYLDSYLRCWRDLITTFDDTVAAFETFNEPNDWQGSTSAILTPLQFAELQTEAYRIAKERGAFCVSGPILSHDWSGGAVGYDYLLQAFPSHKVPADAIGLHLYMATPEAMAERALDWRDKFSQPLILSEFGFEGRDQHVSLSFAVLQPKVAASQLFCLQSWRDRAGLHDWGIVDEHGHRKPAWEEFLACAREYNQAEEALREVNPVPTRPYTDKTLNATPTKPVVFVLPSGQTYNTYVGGAHPNNEASATEWLAQQKIMPALRANTGLDAYLVYPQAEDRSGDAATAIPKSIKLMCDYAKAHPTIQVYGVSLHTDSLPGVADVVQHFGSFWLPGSQAMARSIEKQLAQVHGKQPRFSWDMTGEGYYALGKGNTVPPNLHLCLIEIANHGDKTARGALMVRWIEDNVDTLGWAIETGIGNALVPEETDWQQMYEAEKKRADGLQEAGKVLLGKVDNAVASIEVAQLALDKARKALT